MRKERTKPGFKIHLLALVLSLALLWYSINPAPHTVIRCQSQPDPPDAKRGEAEPEIKHAPLSLQVYRPHRWETSDTLPSDEEAEDFEWPEFIDG